MRKNLIAMSVATLVAGLGMAGGATAAVITTGSTATAEVVNPGGTGHQLLVPYFTTQGGNVTLLNIVNTDTVHAKALKVRFRGASNSDDIFDFQLFLSAGDVWAANIARGSDGRSVLTTVDKSCTLPVGVGAGAGSSFVTARLPSTLSADDQATQTREGYVEIFNMADVKVGSALETAVTHINGVPPCNGGGTSTQNATATTTMNALAVDPTAATYDGMGLANPTSGLMANFTFVNVTRSGAWSGEATSITAVNGAVPPVAQPANIVFFPQTNDSAPIPADAFTADPLLRTASPVITPSMFDLPDLSTPYTTTAPTDPIAQAGLLSTAIATKAVINEFLTDTTIAAGTDWVFSMPTRRYAVAFNYAGTTSATKLAVNTTASTFFTSTNVSVSGNQLCVKTDGLTYRNREEVKNIATSFVISPNPPQLAFNLCGETSVLSFNGSAATAVLSASVANTAVTTAGIADGWAQVGTSGLGSGLPILGKSFVRAAPGAGVGFFGASWEHRYTK